MKAIILAVALITPTIAQAKQDEPFFSKTNVALFSADALIRGLDAESTRRNLTNPCHCFVEDNTPAISAKTWSEYTYSLGVTSGIVAMSYLAHRTGHHRIEKLIPMIDVAYDAPQVAHNYLIANKRPLSTK
jgi:hypothetical protein